MHKITYFLRTLSRVSLSGLSLQSFKGSRFWSPWVWLRSILIPTLALLFFSSLFLLPFLPASQVSAQVPTPTSTFQPMFPSATPEPTRNVECIGTQPSGWLTVTPDPYWYLNCLQCITPVTTQTTETPYPVSTYMIPLTQTQEALYGTATPMVEATPTLSVLPTSTSVNSSVVWDPSLGTGNCHVDSSTAVCELLSPTVLHVTITQGHSPYTANFYPTLHNLFYDTLGNMPATVYFYAEFLGYGDDPTSWGFSPWNGAGIGTAAVAGATLSGSSDYVVGPIGHSSGYAYYHSWFWPNVWGDRSVDAWLSIDAPYNPNVTPTPTATPSELSYCASVVPIGGDEGVPGFELPVPGIGQTFCPVDFGGVTIPLFGIFGWEDFHLPALQICFTEISFGTLTYYDMAIEIDYLAYIFAASTIVSIFIRK